MEQFKANILAIYGAVGKSWLDSLPKLLAQIASQWNLTDLEPLTNLSFNYVLKGYQSNQAVILKLSLDLDQLEHEFHTLECFSAYGGVKVLDYQSGALLLESIEPGDTLKDYVADDLTKIRLCCQLVQQLHQAPLPASHQFPHFQDGLSILERAWNLPETYLLKARALKNELLSSNCNEATVLLHADLHHANILRNNTSWRIIDPKGLIGLPINEMWAFVMDVEKDTQFIADFFKYEVLFVRKWYFVHVMLAACWNLEGDLSPELFLNLAIKTAKLI
jgi:streptomycin 6-kinase